MIEKSWGMKGEDQMDQLQMSKVVQVSPFSHFPFGVWILAIGF